MLGLNKLTQKYLWKLKVNALNCWFVLRITGGRGIWAVWYGFSKFCMILVGSIGGHASKVKICALSTFPSVFGDQTKREKYE